MSEKSTIHFIKNIAIKKFKCFEDFSANEFQRVNLITGKNNVGKTTFMEACFLMSNIADILKKSLVYGDETDSEIVKLFLILQQHREKQEFNLKWLTEELKLNFENIELEFKNELRVLIRDNNLSVCYFYEMDSIKVNLETKIVTLGTVCCENKNYYMKSFFNLAEFRKHKAYQELYTKNHLPLFNNYSFNAVSKNIDELINSVDDFKLKNKISNLNNILLSMFDISEIDVINATIWLRKNDKILYKLSTFGDGISHFIFIITSIMSSKNSVVYLDEVENGIHYSKLDELWEVILKTSKELNVQIFATTHSKECIDSYARVAKKLRDEEVTLIELGKNEDKIESVVLNYDEIISEVENGMEVRGW
jgi:AAA15 family ATPase/GTPase